MSHHYTKENPPIINRNGISLKLQPATYGKTSPLKGQSFWTGEGSIATADEFFKFIGIDILLTQANRFYRRHAMDVFSDPLNKNEDGTYNWDNILPALAEIESGGFTLVELDEQINELQDEYVTLTQDEKYELNENDQPVYPEDYVRLTEQIKAIVKKIKPLKLKQKEIQAKYQAIAAQRKANKEKAAVKA